MNAKDDFSSLMYETVKRIPVFLVVLITIIYTIVSTDVFDKYVLYKMNRGFLNENGEKSITGFVVTGILFGIVCAVIYSITKDDE